MTFENNAVLIRRELLVRLLKLILNEEPLEQLDRIPLAMIPKNKASNRCCIYKDRAMLKYRLMSVLGFDVQQESDELKSVAAYYRDALEQKITDTKFITVLNEACKECVSIKYFVTNACRGCFARPCTVVCPRGALAVNNGRAQIDVEKCINCGKCKKVCPYQAIVYVPVPCEESCPVGAISKDENGRVNIDYDKCILCGKCIGSCPFAAIVERSQLINVVSSLKNKQKINVLIAPAIAGQFPGGLAKIIGALKQLGFSAVFEVAAGADQTAEHEAAEFLANKTTSFMTTSCCPAYVSFAEKHLPELKDHISQTPSPMFYTVESAKQRDPEALNVFIGPCLAKKQEAVKSGSVDYVLNFEELGALLVAAGIDVNSCQVAAAEIEPSLLGRKFPVIGGVAAALKSRLPAVCDLEAATIDGLNKKNIALLRAYCRGAKAPQFLEVMSCEGGCVAGSGAIGDPQLNARTINNLE